jgi:hypothetical protein
VLNTVNSDYAISENDKLEVTRAGDKLKLKDGETATYDSIKLDNITLLDEKDEAKAEYKALYTAELVMLQ